MVNFLQKGPKGNTVKINNNIVYAIAPWGRSHLFSKGYLAYTSGAGMAQPVADHTLSGMDGSFLFKSDSTTLWMQWGSRVESLNTRTGERKELFVMRSVCQVLPFSGERQLIIGHHTIGLWHAGRFTAWYQNDAQSFRTAERINDDSIIVGGNSGLYYFSISRKSLQPVSGSEMLKVRFLYRDNNSQIWFTTYGQGLYHLADTGLTPVIGDNTGYLKVAHSIVQDKGGDFWVSTNHGLFKLKYASLMEQVSGKSKKLYYTYFDKNDGFNTNEFNGGCSRANIYDTAAGYMYFPSMDGVVKFNPGSIKSIVERSTVFIDQVISNDTSYFSKDSSLWLGRHTSEIRILFSTPYYGNVANVTFSYALSTDPERWHDLANSRTIVLNNLPGGAYTINIKKEETAGHLYSPPFHLI